MTRRDEDGRPLHESWKPIRLLLDQAHYKLTIDEARRLHEVLEIAMSHHDNDEDYNDE
jgi:hypothetical protein